MANPVRIEPPVEVMPISPAHRDKCARLAEGLIDKLDALVQGHDMINLTPSPETIAHFVVAIEGLDRIARGS